MNKDLCSGCGIGVTPERRNYRYLESGLPNVFLQGVEVTECGTCQNSEVAIPRINEVHRGIARSLVEWPGRLTGNQLRFLRKHLELTGEQLAEYLHTDKTKISKWEGGEDPLGPSTDRLIRLVATGLDQNLAPDITPVVEHLRDISEQPGDLWELHIDVETMCTSLVRVSRAA